MTHCARRGLGDKYATRLGDALQPGGQVHRIAQGQVFKVAACPHIPGDHETGVQPNADLKAWQAAHLLELGFVLADGHLKIEGCQHCPFWIIFVRSWGAKKGQCAVAQELRDQPLVAGDGLA